MDLRTHGLVNLGPVHAQLAPAVSIEMALARKEGILADNGAFVANTGAAHTPRCMVNSSRAVFLSYASQDAEAVQGIAVALRAAGLEVWFDRNELRGGDAWDAKIRQQIRECALFVPVISTATQARAEGYFRLEWKLAVDRSHLMADDAPFLLPLVIDETPEAAARVPDRFRERQWLRVPGGEADAGFVERVRRLLADNAVASHHRYAASVAPERRRPRSFWPWAAMGILAIVGVWFALNFRRSTPVAEEVPEKSVAVLPFANMSENRDSAFFADGMHEDILTDLALVGGLEVISRTSVMGYRNTTKAIRLIGRELHVAYILEGSVRRIGDSVRVTGQLIDARTDHHLWAKAYDRRLSDVFAIQAELAKEIAAALHAALTPTEQARIESPPTASTAAYDLYLKGREIERSSSVVPDTVPRAQPLFESAVELDPTFVLAWTELALVHLRAWGNFDMSGTRLAKANAALDHATQLAPGQMEVLQARLAFGPLGKEWRGEEAVLQRMRELYPNHPATLLAVAYSAKFPPDRWRDRLAGFLRVLAVDPRNPSLLEEIGAIHLGVRHYDEAAKYLAEATALQPANIRRDFALAIIPYYARGSTATVDALVAGVSAEARRSDPETISVLANWAFERGDAAGLVKLWEESGANWRFAYLTGRFDLIVVAMAMISQGETERARSLLEKNLAELTVQLVNQPDNGNKWAALALTHAMLGNSAAAEEVKKKARQMVPWDNAIRFADAWGGKKDGALSDLRQQMQNPPFNPIDTNVHVLRRQLSLWPLLGDPRFEALLNDPGNNAPVP